MPNQVEKFWSNFQNKDFNAAQKQFDELSEKDKQAVFAELFQKSEFHRQPIMVSVLQRVLHDNKSFDDFYQAWLPTEKMSNKIEIHGQSFQQHFPSPVRVINAININNPKEIISIGITWVANPEEEKSLWEYINKNNSEKDKNNQIRHDSIQEVAEGKLLGLFRVESDDNLGTPF